MNKYLTNLFALTFFVFALAQDNEESVEEVVVVGTKASIISALSKQQASDKIVSVADSDALGDFPDTTAAEAIRRLSGITVENDQGEGRYVSIRGLSGDLNSIAVNGALVPAPEEGRKVMLDGLPTELLDYIEVYKSLTPDMDADAIGGHIEFNTKRASSLDGTLFKVKFDTSYNDQTENADNPKFAMTYGSMINDRLGHVLGVTYSSKQIIAYNNETGFPGWTEDDDGDKYFDDDWEMRYYDLTRERFGLTYDIDYQLNDTTFLYANLLVNEYEDDEVRFKDEYGSLKFGDIDGDLAEIVRIRRDAEVRKRIENRTIRTMIVGLETDFNGWFTEVKFSNSFAEQDDTDNVDAKFRSTRYECEPCGYFTYNNAQTPSFTFNPGVADIWNTGMGIDGFEEEDDISKDKESAIKVDFTKDGFDVLNKPTTIKFGFKKSSRTKRLDNEVWEWEDDVVTQDQAFFGAASRVDWPFPGQQMGPMADPNLLFTYQNSWGPYTRGQTEKDYLSEEEIFSAYVMGTLEYDNAVVIAGVRVEDTQFDTQGFNAETGELILGENNYTFLAPSLNIKYFLSDEAIIRAAYWKSLARPSFNESAPVSDFKSDGDNQFKGEMGNPDLDPYEATNYDLSYEYYGKNTSYSLGFFWKDIENAIYPLVTSGTFNGIVFNELETYVNTDDSKVDGIELNVFHEFADLPDPFDGLFVQLNITKTDGQSTLVVDSGSVTFPFRKLSEDVYNLSVGYDKGPFDVRLSMVSRSPYLDYLADEDPASTQEDLTIENIRYTDDNKQLDFNLKYDINDNLSVKFDINNINDEPEYYYWGRSDRLSQYDVYGTTYSLGIRYKL